MSDLTERVKHVFGKLYKYLENLQHEFESLKMNIPLTKRQVEEIIQIFSKFYDKLLVESQFIKNNTQKWMEIPKSAEEISNLLFKNFNNLKSKKDLKEFRQVLGFIEFFIYHSLKESDNLNQISEALEKKGTSIDKILTDYENSFEETKEKILQVVKEDGISLQSVSDQWKDDLDVVIQAVKQDGNALYYASEKMKKNREVVIEAIKQNGSSLQFAPEEFRNDKEIVSLAVKNDGLSLKYSSLDFRSDKELVKDAVMKNGQALGYASTELKSDKEIVKEAVKNDGMSLYFADETLKADRDIVKNAVKQSGDSIQYASKELKEDRGIVMEVMKQNLTALKFIPEKVQNHYEIRQLKQELKRKK